MAIPPPPPEKAPPPPPKPGEKGFSPPEKKAPPPPPKPGEKGFSPPEKKAPPPPPKPGEKGFSPPEKKAPPPPPLTLRDRAALYQNAVTRNTTERMVYSPPSKPLHMEAIEVLLHKASHVGDRGTMDTRKFVNSSSRTNSPPNLGPSHTPPPPPSGKGPQHGGAGR